MIHLDTAGFLLRSNDPFLPSMTHLDALQTTSATSTSIMMAIPPSHSPCPSPDTTTTNINEAAIENQSEDQPRQKPVRAKLMLNARMLHFGKSVCKQYTECLAYHRLFFPISCRWTLQN